MKNIIKFILGIVFSAFIFTFLGGGIVESIENSILILILIMAAAYFSIKFGFKLADKLINRPKNKTKENKIIKPKKEDVIEDKPETKEEPARQDIVVEVDETQYVYKPTSIFKVAGVTAKNDEGKDIQKLISSYVKDWLGYNDAYEGLTNKEIKEDYYGERVYEADVFSFDDITFVPEPDNPYDANAIKVMHGELGHIGYVPKNETKRMFEIIENYSYDVSGEIIGGKYKYVDEYEDKVKVNKHNYGIKLIVSAE